MHCLLKGNYVFLLLPAYANAMVLLNEGAISVKSGEVLNC